MQPAVVVIALAGLIGVGAAAADEGGARFAVAVAIGAVGGLALYQAAFGFTGAWRRWTRERRGAGLRAQILLIAAAVCLSFPLITFGRDLGWPVGAWVFPFGLSSAIGAAMFGFGMQLGGGCGSGTLFTAGGGSSRMWLTLAAFVAGSVIWTGTNPEFQSGLSAGLAALGIEGRSFWSGTSLLREIGWSPALMATLAALALLAWWTMIAERRAHGELEAPRAGGHWLRGPWSREFAALALAGVVIACFLALGRPWGVTAAFPLWGAKIADG
ncbi:MAG: YeeE/YedE thiosulfate transporter family protein, partial [Pseudomonadota bacterium]